MQEAYQSMIAPSYQPGPIGGQEGKIRQFTWRGSVAAVGLDTHPYLSISSSHQVFMCLSRNLNALTNPLKVDRVLSLSLSV